MTREELNKYYTFIMESEGKTLDLGKEVAGLLLSSPFSSAFICIVKHLETAQSLGGGGAEVATGAVSVTHKDVPHVSPPCPTKPSSLHKRSTTATTTECESTAAKVARAGSFQCSCRIFQQHIESCHPGHNWTCSDKECDKVYSDKASLRKNYIIKHMDIYYFMCDLYDEFEHEQEALLKYHKEIMYDIPSDIRCVPCYKPFHGKKPNWNNISQYVVTSWSHFNTLKNTGRNL